MQATPFFGHLERQRHRLSARFANHGRSTGDGACEFTATFVVNLIVPQSYRSRSAGSDRGIRRTMNDNFCIWIARGMLSGY